MAALLVCTAAALGAWVAWGAWQRKQKESKKVKAVREEQQAERASANSSSKPSGQKGGDRSQFSFPQVSPIIPSKHTDQVAWHCCPLLLPASPSLQLPA